MWSIRNLFSSPPTPEQVQAHQCRNENQPIDSLPAHEPPHGGYVDPLSGTTWHSPTLVDDYYADLHGGDRCWRGELAPQALADKMASEQYQHALDALRGHTPDTQVSWIDAKIGAQPDPPLIPGPQACFDASTGQLTDRGTWDVASPLYPIQLLDHARWDVAPATDWSAEPTIDCSDFGGGSASNTGPDSGSAE